MSTRRKLCCTAFFKVSGGAFNMSLFCRALVIISVCITTGCATVSVDNLPSSNEEFSIPPKEILSKYPDIERLSLSTNRIAAADEKVYTNLVEKWGKPDEVINAKKGNIANAALGITAFSLPFAFLVPDPAFIAVGAGILAVDLGLVYLLTPREDRVTWHKGDYRIESQTMGEGYKQQLTYWEWSHKDKSCDCYSALLSKRSPTAMFFDGSVGAEFSSVYIDEQKLESDPGFSFRLSPGINLALSRPIKIDIAAAVEISRTAYSTTPELNFSAIQQLGIRLGLYRPFLQNDRMRIGGGLTMPLRSWYIDDTESYTMTEHFPRLFVHLDYMFNGMGQIGYELSYDRLDDTRGNRLQIHEFSIRSFLRTYF